MVLHLQAGQDFAWEQLFDLDLARAAALFESVAGERLERHAVGLDLSWALQLAVLAERGNRVFGGPSELSRDAMK